MMRSAAYNCLGVLMGTSWPASCPRWSGLRGHSLPMITLFPSQGDFYATAPGHMMGAIPCVLAVLPIGALCLVFTSVRLHTVTMLLPATVPPLLPLVPPRQATR